MPSGATAHDQTVETDSLGGQIEASRYTQG